MQGQQLARGVHHQRETGNARRPGCVASPAAHIPTRHDDGNGRQQEKENNRDDHGREVAGLSLSWGCLTAAALRRPWECDVEKYRLAFESCGFDGHRKLAVLARPCLPVIECHRGNDDRSSRSEIRYVQPGFSEQDGPVRRFCWSACLVELRRDCTELDQLAVVV